MSLRKSALQAVAFTALAVGTAAAGSPRGGQLNTVQYCCDKGSNTEMSYYFGASRAYALVKVNGKTIGLNALDSGDADQSS